MSKAKKTYYYNVNNDMEMYPEAIFIFTFGGRGTGKTYGALKTVIDKNMKFAFIKRTIEDVKLLTAGNKLGKKKEEGDASFDASPFKPLNRDFGYNIRAFSVYPGLGAFYNCDENNNAEGEPLGYITALSAVGKIKGFDLSDVDVMIFDEFCPKSFEIVSKNEDSMILDMYKTLSRDREHRGRKPLLFWAFANSDNVVSPLMRGFDLLDTIATMTINNQEYNYNKDTKVLLHKLKTAKEFIDREAQSPIYKAASNSKWAKMALGNDFAFNDFSQIGKRSLKGMVCEAKIHYNNKTHFVYYSAENAARYITYTNFNKTPMYEYDLNKVTHKKKFITYAETMVLQLYYGQDEPIFETYQLFDLYTMCRKIL